jgi:hypothetical protein
MYDTRHKQQKYSYKNSSFTARKVKKIQGLLRTDPKFVNHHKSAPTRKRQLFSKQRKRAPLTARGFYATTSLHPLYTLPYAMTATIYQERETRDFSLRVCGSNPSGSG